MGLEEKKWVNEGKTEWVPKYQAEAQQAAGKAIAFEVDWNTFANDLKALQYFENQGLVTLVTVLKKICRESVGKEAIQAVNKVVFKNLQDPSAKKANVAGGVIEIDAAWGKDGYFEEGELYKAIEQGL